MTIYFANYDGSFVLTKPNIVKILNQEKIDVLITEEDWNWSDSIKNDWMIDIYTKDEELKNKIINTLEKKKIHFSPLESDLWREYKIFNIKIDNMMIDTQNSFEKNKGIPVLNCKIFENNFEIEIIDPENPKK